MTHASDTRVRIRGQSEIAQQRRLRLGRCPVHGLYLIPLRSAVFDGTARVGQLGTCPRKDCKLAFVITAGEKLGEVDGVEIIITPARRIRKHEQVMKPTACSELKHALTLVGYHRKRRRGQSKAAHARKMRSLNVRLLMVTARAVQEIVEAARGRRTPPSG